MEKYSITKDKFLNWYFNTGEDKDLLLARADLGHRVIDGLIEKGSFSVTVLDMWNECEHGCFPTSILEEAASFEEDVDLMDLKHEWEVELK